MTIGDRIEARRKTLGIKTQSDLARLVPMGQSTLNGLIRKPYRWSPYLTGLARVLRTTVEYLVGEIDDPDEGAVPEQTSASISEQLDLVPIATVDLRYGMGAAFLDSQAEVEIQHFPRVIIEALTDTPPEHLTFARGSGKSMAPTIGDGDWVLIDRSKRRPEDQDEIWALTMGDVGMIKRLRLREFGVTLLSDNPAVPPDEASGDEVHIVGRATAVIKKL